MKRVAGLIAIVEHMISRLPPWLWNPELSQPWKSLYAPVVAIELALAAVGIPVLLIGIVTRNGDLYRWSGLSTTVFFCFELGRRVIGWVGARDAPEQFED
jgi:hypothetical protein